MTMKRFNFRADAYFSAENLDDAFNRLAEHFKRVMDGKDSELFEDGEMHLEPCDVVSYLCTNCGKEVKAVKGKFFHPHLGKQDGMECPYCFKPVGVK